MYIYQPLQTKTMPTPLEISEILRLADEPELKNRDTRPLMATLMRMKTASSRLAGHILTRRTACTAFSSRMTADGDSLDQANEALARLKPLIRTVSAHALQSPLYGALAMQVDWSLIDGRWRPRLLKRYKPVDLDQDDEIVHVVSDGQKPVQLASIPINDHDDTWIVDTSDDDERGGVLRPILEQVAMSVDMRREWANYTRKLKGMLQAVVREGATAEEINEASEALRNAVKNNFTVRTEAIQMIVDEIVKGSSDSFQQITQALSAEISIAILGQANTSELPAGGGSRAALQILQLIRADIHYDDMSRIERIVNDQVVLADYRRNYDPGAAAAPWRWEFVMPEEIPLLERAQVTTMLLDAGVALKADEVYTNNGFSRPESVADIIQRTEPA